MEQRSELVDIVTKLAKEEAAAEKGAAAAAAQATADNQDSGLAGAFDVLELTVSDSPSKGNAAAALKQVCFQSAPELSVSRTGLPLNYSWARYSSTELQNRRRG